MDGYEELVKTKSWAAIRAADAALLAAYKEMKGEGFPMAAECAFQARVLLSQADNNLRYRFKMIAQAEA